MRSAFEANGYVCPFFPFINYSNAKVLTRYCYNGNMIAFDPRQRKGFSEINFEELQAGCTMQLLDFFHNTMGCSFLASEISLVKPELVKRAISDAFCLTIVRDPFERAASNWKYDISRPRMSGRSDNFSSWRKLKERFCMPNFFVRFLSGNANSERAMTKLDLATAKKTLESFDMVISMNRDNIGTTLSSLGLTKELSLPVNTSKSQNLRITEQEKESFLRDNQLDYELHDYVLSIPEKRHESILARQRLFG